VLWRDLDCAPHPGQKVGCRLSTMTVQACSPCSTLTTFKPAAADHVIDVFIAPCCRIPSQGASSPAHHRERRTRRRLHQESIRPGIWIISFQGAAQPFVRAGPADGLARAEVDHMRAAAEGIQAWLRAYVGVLGAPKAFEVELLRAEQDKFDHPLGISRAVVVNPEG
jgi:hypothetical protein